MFCERRRGIEPALTLQRCANHSAEGMYVLHGLKLRALHSSMMGRYRLGNNSSLSSGLSDKMASPMTWSVSSRNSFSMSTDAPVPLTTSSLAHRRSVARVAMPMMSSRISTRSALPMLPRILRHVSPPLVTSPVPERRFARKRRMRGHDSARVRVAGFYLFIFKSIFCCFSTGQPQRREGMKRGGETRKQKGGTNSAATPGARRCREMSTTPRTRTFA